MSENSVIITDDRFEEDTQVEIQASMYKNGITALVGYVVEDGNIVEYFGNYTVNLIDYMIVPEHSYQVIIPDYSEHAGAYEILEKNGIVKSEEMFLSDENGALYFGPFRTKAIVAEVIHPDLRAQIDALEEKFNSEGK